MKFLKHIHKHTSVLPLLIDIQTELKHQLKHFESEILKKNLYPNRI